MPSRLVRCSLGRRENCSQANCSRRYRACITLAGHPGLACVGVLLSLRTACAAIVAAATAEAAGAAGGSHAASIGERVARSAARSAAPPLLPRLDAAIAALPNEWRAAAGSATELPTVAARARAVLRLHGACGWTAPDSMRAPPNSSVRLLKEALEHVTLDMRTAKHAAFVAEAMGPAASAASVAAAALRLRTQLLPALWRLRWENE
jgi:hypothetical protein